MADGDNPQECQLHSASRWEGFTFSPRGGWARSIQVRVGTCEEPGCGQPIGSITVCEGGGTLTSDWVPLHRVTEDGGEPG